MIEEFKVGGKEEKTTKGRGRVFYVEAIEKEVT